MDLEETSSLTF